MTTATVDLTVAGTGGTINGAVFTNQSTNSGTGIFNTFVQLQDKGIEQGYNSDAAPQFDESTSHKHNHSILLADVPIFIGDGTGGTVEGVVYREFRFNANEVGGAGRLLSLDKLEIWQEESGSLTNFTSAGSAAAGVHYASGPGFAGAHTDYLAYNLDQGGDRWIAIDSGLSSGSGKGDMRVFIPDSYFINDAAHRYVTLFSQFGAQGGNYGASSGYEEWGVNSTSAGSGNTATFLLNKTASVNGGTADIAGEVISLATSSTTPPIATSRCFRNSARRGATTAPAAATRSGASTRRAPAPATPQPSCSTRPRWLTAERRTAPARSSA